MTVVNGIVCVRSWRDLILIVDFDRHVLVVKDGKIDVSRGQNGRIGRGRRGCNVAASWKTNELIQISESNLVFIDFDERNMLRRIDLSDFKSNHIIMNDFIGNITIPPSGDEKNIIYCLSKLTNTIYRIRIDISLLIAMDSKKIPDCEGRMQ